ncbi:hypothetical protein [uncultured Dokdonia sp.]|uniref:hypothetical protein n=1 Tax=uncultured Dokdonia sp. TaxID=575653 RepID=UPI0026348D3B|nr:hypothetical protein [uncultured Dokdonia sp.]
MKTTQTTSILRSVILCVALLCTAIGYAQIDAPRKSIKIDGKQDNEAPKPILVSPENASSSVSSSTVSVKSKVRLGTPESGTKKREVRFMEGDEFAKKDYTALENKLNKDLNYTKDAGLKPEYYNDQFFGEFNSGSKFVRFLYRDHEYVDGDRVSVAVNDTIIHPNIHLAGEFQGFYIDLKTGFNKIDITALNQGTSGPNTAQFVMYDDNREVISSNIWNLATGVKATVIIVKD